MPEILALIPARGGSKGIPRKNIKSFAGYPLIAWSIAAGLQAKGVSRVIVSTDDEEIAAVLTKEQLPRFEEFKRQRGKLQFNRGPNGGSRPGIFPGDRPLPGGRPADPAP